MLDNSKLINGTDRIFITEAGVVYTVLEKYGVLYYTPRINNSGYGRVLLKINGLI